MAVRWGRWLRWIFLIAMLSGVAVIATLHHDELRQAGHLMARASPWYMLAAVGSIVGVYFNRGSAYRVALTIMGYSLDRWFLSRTALVATSIHQLIPTGGASGYAFLTYAFNQRGISAGQASIVALVDTVTYAAALASLVIVALIHLVTGGSITGASLTLGLIPGLLLLAAACGLYYLQRDHDRLLRFAKRAKNGIARLLGREWADGPLERFIGEYYEGKRLVMRTPRRFFRMLAYQYGAVAFDCLTLYLMFVALGVLPNPWIVFVGFVVAMAGVSVVAVPAGGGSFEIVMSSFFATHGIKTADGLAAALLYRVAAFWLPVLWSIVILLRLRRRRRAVRRIERPEP
ncbi:MAG TPA: lysylphosphatidylglycerol synthase transmembrane domain-containing protein [Gammaproteobacteria bacterium]|nr:lysylphosphatidylglycerol synthase transmembrane domain-containing protein [Gammaproteobacteria bacterium]